ncbi:MAG: hypothetical protein JO131_00295, partial [Gammaproteobacteria bacterium]|nr:hypothetical protein [Gammaproteobacteria bacterium]
DTLIIVAHGSPKYIGGRSSKELAEILANHINKYARHVKGINLYACNTGRTFENRCFMEELSFEMSKLLNNDSCLELTAPTGIIAFYNTGDSVVFEDKNPYLRDRKFSEEINSFNNIYSKASHEKIKHLLINDHDKFKKTGAVPLNEILKTDYVIDEALEDKTVPFVERQRPSMPFKMSLATYNWITKVYSTHYEQDGELNDAETHKKIYGKDPHPREVDAIHLSKAYEGIGKNLKN